MASFRIEKTYTKKILAVSLGVASGLIFGYLKQATVSADADLTVNINVEEAISLTLSNSAQKITYSDLDDAGTFGYSDFSIGIDMNIPLGYTLSMYSSSSASTASSLADSSNLDNTIPTLSADATVTNLGTGAGWGDDNMNHWGYALGTTSDSSSSWTFHGVSGSSESATVLSTVNGSDVDISKTDTTNIILGSMVDVNQVAGDYSTTLNFTLVVSPTYTYALIFDANGGSNTPDALSSGVDRITSTSETFTIPSDAPTSSDSSLSFLGWSLDPSATTADYESGDTYVMNETSYNNTATLYAVYGTLKTLSDITTMQEMTPTICAATATPSASDGASTPQYQLEDTRDGKLYWVAKLADGSCWMTQNLDYDIKADGTDVVSAINNSTTSTWSANATYAPQATTTGDTPYNNSVATGTYSYDPGDYYFVDGSGDKTAVACTASSNGGENCHYHLGNYYQYNAAAAGTSGNFTYADVDVTASICPKGWRLPAGNSYTDNYSFGKLTNAYGITSSSTGSDGAALLASPLWFVRAGYLGNGVLYEQGDTGRIWSSWTGAGSTYRLYFASNCVNPFDHGNRFLGLTVRCVAR